MKPKEVHAWEIKGYIKVNKTLKYLIRTKLKKNFESFNKASNSLNLSKYHYELSDRYKKSETLFKLTDAAKIPRYLIEKYIISWKDSKRDLPKGGYKIKFPIKINPIHTRIISHLIGDGTISITDTWVQKDTAPLKPLFKKILKTNLEKRNPHSSGEVITIPKFFKKLFSRVLEIPFEEEFNKKILIKKLIKLPKEHRIQVLTAIIEDEGTINRSNITIRMRDKEIMETIKNLIDSLGYRRSNLYEQNAKSGYSNKRKLLYGISLNALGAKKYIKDLKEIENQYGPELGLWTKKEKVNKIINMRELISGKERNKRLEKQIFKNSKKVNFNEVKRNFQLTDNETMSVLRYIVNRNLAKKIKWGVYKKII